MTTLRAPLLIVASVLMLSDAWAAENIGVTAAVTNKVTGTLEGDARTLDIGSGIFQDETIDTWKESTTQLMFLDETTITMGPESSMLLDKFVFDPDSNTGEFVLSTTKGAFRFITGSVDPSSYTIETPIATMGVRGTIIEWRVNKNNVLLKLVHGAADICNTGGSCLSLDRPGTYVVTDGSNFSDIQNADGTSGTIVLEEADDNLYAAFLGSKRIVAVQRIREAAKPGGGGGCESDCGPTAGFAPILTGAGTIPAGLDINNLPPGLANNRDPVTFKPFNQGGNGFGNSNGSGGNSDFGQSHNPNND